MLTDSAYRPDICARDGASCGPSVKRLGLSECAFGCAESVTAALRNELSRTHLYPDGGCSDLRAVVARTYAVDIGNVLVTNGADEALVLIALAFAGAGREIAVPSKTFLGYRAVAELVRGSIVETATTEGGHDWESLASAVRPGTVLFACNPHNPTGALLPFTQCMQLARLCRAHDAWLIVDEAYIDYSPEQRSCIELIHDHPCIVIRSLSKSHGLAGLRCGFVLAAQQAIGALLRLKHALPFSVNRFAVAAGIAALDDKQFKARVVERIVANRAWFRARLHTLGIECPESGANFLLVPLPVAGAVAQRFLLEQGVLVKDTTAMGFERHVRVGIGTIEEMEAAAEALARLVTAHENRTLAAAHEPRDPNPEHSSDLAARVDTRSSGIPCIMKNQPRHIDG